MASQPAVAAAELPSVVQQRLQTRHRDADAVALAEAEHTVLHDLTYDAESAERPAVVLQ